MTFLRLSPMARRMRRESSARAVKTSSSIASVSRSISRMTGPKESTMSSLSKRRTKRLVLRKSEN